MDISELEGFKEPDILKVHNAIHDPNAVTVEVNGTHHEIAVGEGKTYPCEVQFLNCF